MVLNIKWIHILNLLVCSWRAHLINRTLEWVMYGSSLPSGYDALLLIELAISYDLVGLTDGLHLVSRGGFWNLEHTSLLLWTFSRCRTILVASTLYFHDVWSSCTIAILVSDRTLINFSVVIRTIVDLLNTWITGAFVTDLAVCRHQKCLAVIMIWMFLIGVALRGKLGFLDVSLRYFPTCRCLDLLLFLFDRFATRWHPL